MPGYRKLLFLSILMMLLCVGLVQPGYAKENRLFDRYDYDEPNFQIDIGDCTWNGTKSNTSVTFTLTNTKAEVHMPSGAYFPLSMSRPVITVGLESGKYNYIWWDDFDPVFYIWKTRIEGSFTLNECRPQATASVTVGACSWNETSGSVTPVTIKLDHASLTLNGTVYTEAQTVISDLAPGSYTYSWVGIDGFEGGGSNLEINIPDCTPEPAVVTVHAGRCKWDEIDGSITEVVFSISGASLTLSGPSGTSGPFTSNTTLPLEPGHYSYIWTAQAGFSGTGLGSFDLEDCRPKIGTATIVPGACSWNEEKGSTFIASITLEKATLTINSMTYEDSTEIELPCGYYSYTWSAKPGCQGGGTGSIKVEGCEPSSVDIHVGTCDWTGSASITPVTLDITGATLTLFDTTSGTPVQIDQYGPGTYSLSVPTGSYVYSWEANEDFTGSGNGTFETISCIPGKADASVNIGACIFEEGRSLTSVSINVSGAVLTLDSQKYFEKTEMKLEPGEYYFSWEAVSGYEGSGDGTIDIGGCEPASVDIVLGVCDWIDESSLTPVTLDVNGANLTLFVDDGGTLTSINEYGPGSHTINLPMGFYSYSWVADEDFTGSGEGTFDTLDCEPGKADASIILGACTYNDKQSLTIVSVFINGAVITIDGQEFCENSELKLPPGDYVYTWKAINNDFLGAGEGVLSIESCQPALNEDSTPDIAAGGAPPSPIFIYVPAIILILGFSAILIKTKRVEK